jgi:DNA-binding NarL/FixJ family response regulator
MRRTLCSANLSRDAGGKERCRARWPRRRYCSTSATAPGDGTELIGVLREANPRLKVLILTASPEPGLLERMAEAGADRVRDKMRVIWRR